jgi:hypothetical protein
MWFMKKIILILTVLIMTIPVLGQTDSTIICRLWKPDSFCKLPDSINLPDVIYFASATMRSISCHQLDTNKNMTGVWVTFKVRNATELHLKSNFENISLINSLNKDTVHPVAILKKQRFMNSNEPQYDYHDFVTEDHYFAFAPKRKYDLFVLFTKINAGDKLVIENLLEGKIKK